jgi:cytochrome c oxidase subunit 2
MDRTVAESGTGALAERGERAASTNQCLSCHTVDGRRHLAPTWRGLYGSWVDLADGRHVLADESYLTRSMMNPQEDMVLGFQPIMPTYAGRLSSGDVAALLEFMKTLRSPPDPAIVAAPSLAPSAAPSAVERLPPAGSAGAGQER